MISNDAERAAWAVEWATLRAARRTGHFSYAPTQTSRPGRSSPSAEFVPDPQLPGMHLTADHGDSVWTPPDARPRPGRPRYGRFWLL